MITEQHRKLTSVLIGSFEQRASAAGLSCQHREDLKNEIYFSRERQAKKIGVDIAPKDKSGLPDERFVISIESYTLLILPMTLKKDSFDSEFEKAIWWAALVRSNLPMGIEDDLHLLIVGPPESGHDEQAKSYAELIEQDERFCRKFVWLHKSVADETEQDLIDRTFMARPWDTIQNESKVEQLSAVSAFLNRANHPTLPNKTIREWLELASSGEQTGRELAIALLDKFKKPEEE